MLVPQAIVVLLPPLLVAFALLTVLSHSRREFLLKSSALVWVGAILVLAGVFQYAAALVSFNPAAFFLSEIPPYRSGLALASIIYAWQRYPVGALLSLVSGFGSTALVLIRYRELKSSPLVQCAAVTATLTIGIWAAGPFLRLVDAYLFGLPVVYTLRLLYFEFPILPATTLTVAAIAIAAAAAIRRGLGRETGGAFVATSAHAWILGIAGLVAVRFAIDGPLKGYNPYLATRDTEITRILRRETALIPGALFKGRVATIVTNERQGTGVSWDRMIMDDLRHVREVGNDHRFLGLWHFDIPTLQEYSLIISPTLYLLATRALARPDTVQDMRNSYLLTYPSRPVLELLGVRFIVVDEAPHFGNERARAGASTQRLLIELPDANVHGFPVQRVEPVSDATAFLAKLKSGADLRAVAFVQGAAPRESLARAEVDITPFPGRIRIVGRSEGPAFVVLPILYTRCLRVADVGSGTKAPELRRADLALAGLTFDGAVDVTLKAELGLRHDRPANVAGALQRGESCVIALPQGSPSRQKRVSILQLREQEGRDHVTRQVGRSEIDPGVFVGTATKEARSVGSFLPDDLGTIDKARVIDNECAAFAGDQVLGFMETEGRELPEAAKRAVAISRHQRVRGILDDDKAVTFSDIHDRAHLAGAASVVDDKNGLGARRNRRFNLGFVDIERVVADIDENGHRAAQDNGVRR